MKKYVIAACFLAATPSLGAQPKAREPLAVFCAARLMLMADLSETPGDASRLARLERGVAILNRLEHADPPAGYWEWAGTAELMEEPLLAVEADAVLDGVLSQLDAAGIEHAILVQIQQHARRQILEALKAYRSQMGSSEEAPLDDAATAEALGEEILQNLPQHHQPQIEALILSKLDRLGAARGFEANLASLKMLRGILAAVDHLQARRLQAATRATLVRHYLGLVEKRPDLEGPHATALLRLGTGGDARAFLTDLEDRRRGRSSVAVWLAEAIRHGSDATATQASIAAQARLSELRLKMMDGLPFPSEVSTDLLKMSLEWRPPLLPDGTALPRNHGDLEESTLLILAAVNMDPRTGEAGMRAVDSAIQLIGDPRVDAESLLEWALSILGERRAFGEAQFLRYLQESHAVLAKVKTLGADQRVVIAREHRNDTRETLPASFDFQVVEMASGRAVESIEIKQTDRPKTASDIGGILKQATRKIDESGLRGTSARKSLVIQIPWSAAPIEYRRGGLVLISHASGLVEKWRQDLLGIEGGKIGEENLFSEMAQHFPKIPDADFFDEISLTDLDGNQIVVFQRPSSAASQWRILNENMLN